MAEESNTPESNTPESNTPESNTPESNTPESNTPESNASESKPESGKPEKGPEGRQESRQQETRRAPPGPRELRAPRGGRGGRDFRRQQPQEAEEGRYEERVVKINRCATVVKGGRRFSFSALVVVGDREGNVGIGFGKANEVPPSVEKAMKDARKSQEKVSLRGKTIPHRIVGEFRSTRVVLLPASEGTGVIAGAAVRAVVECAGITDILTKVHGSNNPLNVVKATMDGLRNLRNREEAERLRGVEIAG